MLGPKILNFYMYDSEYNPPNKLKDSLSMKNKCFNYVLVPKCPLFRGSTVLLSVNEDYK